ncbi:hypothetical protein R50073_18340 [Maricurvus nonylphenolicus]|uniref:hypothetical protein n=1 Tax=Maricurvus nonylphenolicus TaxID=1008307 RepID=UPI0036F3F40C
MTYCICYIQEGQIPRDVVEQLEEGIKNIVVSNSLGSDIAFTWIVVPEGHGWTAGEPSTSSVVSLVAPPIIQSRRVEILHALCSLWMERTGCHINEVLASVMPNQ